MCCVVVSANSGKRSVHAQRNVAPNTCACAVEHGIPLLMRYTVIPLASHGIESS